LDYFAARAGMTVDSIPTKFDRRAVILYNFKHDRSQI
jgi:hypothetical protein